MRGIIYVFGAVACIDLVADSDMERTMQAGALVRDVAYETLEAGDTVLRGTVGIARAGINYFSSLRL